MADRIKPFTFLDFPVEILVSIFDLLPFKEIHQTRKTCRYLKTVIDGNPKIFHWKENEHISQGRQRVFQRGYNLMGGKDKYSCRCTCMKDELENFLIMEHGILVFPNYKDRGPDYYCATR
jgi:hypothetical protein